MQGAYTLMAARHASRRHAGRTKGCFPSTSLIQCMHRGVWAAVPKLLNFPAAP